MTDVDSQGCGPARPLHPRLLRCSARGELGGCDAVLDMIRRALDTIGDSFDLTVGQDATCVPDCSRCPKCRRCAGALGQNDVQASQIGLSVVRRPCVNFPMAPGLAMNPGASDETWSQPLGQPEAELAASLRTTVSHTEDSNDVEG